MSRIVRQPAAGGPGGPEEHTLGVKGPKSRAKSRMCAGGTRMRCAPRRHRREVGLQLPQSGLRLAAGGAYCVPACRGRLWPAGPSLGVHISHTSCTAALLRGAETMLLLLDCWTETRERPSRPSFPSSAFERVSSSSTNHQLAAVSRQAATGPGGLPWRQAMPARTQP